jgi:hypothetical protein
MKLVTFSRPMAPHGVGDTRLVPDNVAHQLQEDGAISASEPWPASAPVSAPESPRRPIVKPARAIGVADTRVAR